MTVITVFVGFSPQAAFQLRLVEIALVVSHETDNHETDNIGDEEPIHIDQLRDMYTYTGPIGQNIDIAGLTALFGLCWT